MAICSRDFLEMRFVEGNPVRQLNGKFLLPQQGLMSGSFNQEAIRDVSLQPHSILVYMLFLSSSSGFVSPLSVFLCLLATDWGWVGLQLPGHHSSMLAFPASSSPNPVL